MSIISRWTQAVLRFLFPFLLIASFLIKIGYVTTCDCRAVGQPFNAWFFPAFHHFPWTFYWTFHGITWLAGPYSILWWILNSPAYFGYWVFFSFILMSDLLIALILRKENLGWAYIWVIFSVWFVTVDPVDFWIVGLTFLGHRRSSLLVLAPLAKLPLGSEPFVGLRAWTFVLNDPNSFHGPENFGRYLMLASFWIVSACLYLNESGRIIYLKKAYFNLKLRIFSTPFKESVRHKLGWLGEHHFFWLLGQGYWVFVLYIVGNMEWSFLNGFSSGRIFFSLGIFGESTQAIDVQNTLERIEMFLFISFAGWFFTQTLVTRASRYWKILRDGFDSAESLKTEQETVNHAETDS